MKKLPFVFITFLVLSCSSVKVLDTWKGDDSNITKFKGKNVLVLGRTANDHSRIAFEEAIANNLRKQGIKATESFIKAPKINPKKEFTKERIEFIKSLMASEGFNAIVITSIKDKQQITRSTNSGIYMGATYGNYYPVGYGTFYDYFALPYIGGSYYSAYGDYITNSVSTTTETKYILETAAYNLDEPKEGQLVAILTTSINNPKDAYKTADTYVKKLVSAFEKAQ